MNGLIRLVEDNEITVDVMREQLKRLRHRVVRARNGADAVVSAIAAPPDVSDMDIQMPVMDGYQAAAQIHKEPKTQSNPILAAIAKAMSGDKQTCLDSGCNDSSAKSFTHMQLQIADEKLISKP